MRNWLYSAYHTYNTLEITFWIQSQSTELSLTLPQGYLTSAIRIMKRRKSRCQSQYIIC